MWGGGGGGVGVSDVNALFHFFTGIIPLRAFSDSGPSISVIIAARCPLPLPLLFF